jgi:hypothetical protein
MGRALVALALLAAGCGEEPRPPSRVEGPRLLAVVAEPPVARPGDDVTLTPLVAAPDGPPDVTFEWSVDLSTRALAAAAGQRLGEEGEEEAPRTLASEGSGATLAGAETAAAIEALLARVGDAPPGTREDAVRLVYETVGLVVTVRAVMRDAAGRALAEGFKRVLLAPAPEASANPPAPRFAVGGIWMSGRDVDGPFRCVPEEAPPEVRAGAAVELAPEADEGWLETYPALDLEGRLVRSTETAYYSWFAAGGAFDRDVSRAPERSVTWTAPEAPGTVPAWLVVRDGHLGTSACRFEIRVTEP